MSNLDNLEDFKKSAEKFTAGLFLTIDSMGDKLSGEEKETFKKQKSEIDEKMKSLTSVKDMLSDLQNKMKF